MRFVNRESGDQDWKAVHRTADRNLSKVGAAYVGSLSVLRQADREQVHAGLLRGDLGMAIAAFPWDRWARAFDRMVTPRLAETMRQAGEATGKRTVVRKIDFSLEGLFDLLNPQAASHASRIAATLVTNVTDATKWAMRQVVTEAQLQGLGLREQADAILEILLRMAGLDGPRARQLEKYVRLLEDRGYSGSILDQRVAQRRDELLMARAKTIARHETMDAAVAGQVELWNQAIEQGLLPSMVEIEWIGTPDRRECEICRSLDGQRVRFGQLFKSDYNGMTYERAPAHVLCRCAHRLVDPYLE